MARVWLSIGSNVERRRSIRAAVQALRRAHGELILSRVYESASVGHEGPAFFNLVVGFDTELSVAGLQRELRALETRLGRVRSADKNAPRTLDVDLLSYDGRVIKAAGLELPRDEILRYAFVLGPLAEVAPDELHPLEGVSYAELWKRFDRAAQPLTLVAFEFG